MSSAHYLDASAILRIVFCEPGIQVPLHGEGVFVSSRLSEVETFRALDRARLAGHLSDIETARKSQEIHALLERLHLLPISDEVLTFARASFPVNVRALDAIHVATAQVLLSEIGPISFWTHDIRQATAAMSRGLDTFGVEGIGD